MAWPRVSYLIATPNTTLQISVFVPQDWYISYHYDFPIDFFRSVFFHFQDVKFLSRGTSPEYFYYVSLFFVRYQRLWI